MIDQDTLQAIAQLIEASEQRTLKTTTQLITASERRIMQSAVTLMDAEFKPRFNLLAEGQEEILRRMPNEDDTAIVDGRLTDLETVTKRHSQDIAALRKAN